MTRNCSRIAHAARIQLIAAVVAWVLPSAGLAQAQAPELAKDEALVIVKLEGTQRSATFEHVQGIDSFVVAQSEPAKLHTVKAGLYFLKTIEGMQGEMPTPKSSRATFTIIAGSVTYIGDWSVSYESERNEGKPALDYRMNPATIEAARQSRDWGALPLYVAQIGQSPVKVANPKNE